LNPDIDWINNDQRKRTRRSCGQIANNDTVILFRAAEQNPLLSDRNRFLMSKSVFDLPNGISMTDLDGKDLFRIPGSEDSHGAAVEIDLQRCVSLPFWILDRRTPQKRVPEHPIAFKSAEDRSRKVSLFCGALVNVFKRHPRRTSSVSDSNPNLYVLECVRWVEQKHHWFVSQSED
jgi:hypothetical protein